MIAVRLRLALDDDEYAALLQLATQELRGPIEEVRFILRQEFKRRGLLLDEPDDQIMPNLGREAGHERDPG